MPEHYDYGSIDFAGYAVGQTEPIAIDISNAKQVTLHATSFPVLLGTEKSALVNTASSNVFLLPADILMKFDGGCRYLYVLAIGGTATVYAQVVR